MICIFRCLENRAEAKVLAINKRRNIIQWQIEEHARTIRTVREIPAIRATDIAIMPNTLVVDVVTQTVAMDTWL